MTTRPIDDALLVDYTLDLLDEAERRDVEARLAKDPALVGALRRVREELSLPAVGLAPVAAPAALRERLLESVAQDNRFARFAARVAQLIDVTVERARSLLGGIDDPASWVSAPLPNVSLCHLEGGAAVAGAIVGFIKIPAGSPFPPHKHLGREQVLVLQGRMQDSDGTEYGVGELVDKAADTEHHLVALAGPALIYLVVAEQGLEIFGMRIGPGDPRL